jgi:hypothetical protein
LALFFFGSARRYPDLESKDERFLQFDMEMRARWWYENSLRTSAFQAMAQRRIYTPQSDVVRLTLIGMTLIVISLTFFALIR